MVTHKLKIGLQPLVMRKYVRLGLRQPFAVNQPCQTLEQLSIRDRGFVHFVDFVLDSQMSNGDIIPEPFPENGTTALPGLHRIVAALRLASRLATMIWTPSRSADDSANCFGGQGWLI